MKKIGFIGAYDKTDLILYVAKILTTLTKTPNNLKGRFLLCKMRHFTRR